MTEYINRKLALSHPFANGQYDHKNANMDFIAGHESYHEWLQDLPATDFVEPCCDQTLIDCTKEQLVHEIKKLRNQRSSLIDLARDLYADLTEDIKVLNEDLEDARQELKIYLDRWEIEPYDK